MTVLPDWLYPLRYGDSLSNHDWIPLYINRLLNSDFVVYACYENRRADIGTALILWSECFKQDPAGTLPDDDVQLAKIAMFGSDVDAWRKCRAGALHGWARVSIENAEAEDGIRLGHPVIAGIASDMFRRKSGRDQSRNAARVATIRSRVRAKLKALKYEKHVSGSEKIVQAVSSWLDQNNLYITDDNVRAAMEAAVGIPRVVDFNAGNRGK
jgi:hypothetical protein